MQTVGKLSFLEYGQKTGYFVHENFVDKRVQQTATAKKKKKNFPTLNRRLDTSELSYLPGVQILPFFSTCCLYNTTVH